MKHPIDLQIASKIRQARTDIGMTLKDMSSMIGINHNQLSKYERCIDRVTSGRLYDISVVTGKSIGWFYEQEKENS